MFVTKVYARFRFSGEPAKQRAQKQDWRDTGLTQILQMPSVSSQCVWSGREAGSMHKPIIGIVTTAVIASSLMVQPKPAEAGCWGCWAGGGVPASLIGSAVVSGPSRAYTHRSIYGPYWAFPPYSESSPAPYGYYGYYSTFYAPPPCCAQPVYAAPVYAHHYYAHHYRYHRYW
jgi:hypothetical protein